MELEILNNLFRRLSNIAKYARLTNNIGKTPWAKFNLDRDSDGLILTTCVLVYIMEKTFKDENCFHEDITNFLITVDAQLLHYHLSYEDCHALSRSILTSTLANDGAPMYFKGYDPQQKDFKNIYISYITSSSIEINNTTKVTYALSNEGLEFVLGTLEVEENMAITIQSLILDLQINKRDYEKAYESVQQLFMTMATRIKKYPTSPDAFGETRCL